MLRLVHPNDAGQHPRTRRRPPLRFALTKEEAAHFRVVLQNLRRTYGTWRALGAEIGTTRFTLCAVAKGRMRASGDLIILAARAARMTVEQVLSGKLDVAGRCPTCGRGSA
jgi:hypothetical protein